MRILSFSHDSELYGAQRSLVGMLRGLRLRDHEVMLAVPSDGPLIDLAQEEGIETVTLPYPYPSSRPLRALRFLLAYPGAAAGIRRLAEEVSPDVIHYNTAACVAPAAALRRSLTAKVWHLREAAPHRKRLSRWVLRWCDSAIFNCRYIARQYPLLERISANTVVHNGIDVLPPRPEEIAAVRAEFGWREGDYVVVFAGQLRPHKDPMAVVEAVATGRRRGVPIKACIAGEGPLRGELKGAIASLELDSMVAVPGFHNNPLALIAASDVLVCPSLEEPFPRVGLEAMALGKPVVATTVGGIPEQVAQGETGILVPPGDKGAFASALISLSIDSEMRAEMGSAAAERHAMHFTESAYAAGVEAVMLRLVSN